ncbi:MAG: PBP1A family penicillin-binding protein [Elusimicrobia bacterium]|nr:PBP1A family penicillin-binding protein [Elusimicrobiota bacterium]
MTRRRLYLAFLFASVFLFTGSVFLRKFFENIPPLEVLETYEPSLTTRVYDVHGEVIAELFTERRALIPLSHIPLHLQNAVLATEDTDFYEHWGISLKGALRAAVRNFLAGRVVQGGSTITMQLSRIMFLSQERTILRKLREQFLALQLERNFSKKEIMQMYLNQVYFGHGAYGVQSASRIYFGKEVEELRLAECATLAALVKAPAHYSPFNHPEKARGRRDVVLARMREEGYLTAFEESQAGTESIPMDRPSLVGAQALYFVEAVRQELEPKYGFDAIWQGGLKIYTTLDLGMQKKAEEVLEKHLKLYDALREKELQEELEENPGLYEVEGSTVAFSTAPIQGALVTIEVRSGAVRAMVGGRSFETSQFNRATQALRQPGSTFKPFVWAAALEDGYIPSTAIEDRPLAYYNDGKDWRLLEDATDYYTIRLATSPFPPEMVWVPNNFDGKFLGTVTLRRALELSRNLVSIRLTERVGPSAVVQMARKAGIQGSIRPVLSIALGTTVVPLVELVSAFGTFANSGIRADPYKVVRVVNSEGKVLEEHVPIESEVLSPQTTYILVNMMKGVVERGTGRGARWLNRPLAGKTGTTQDHRDLWFVGFTPDIVTGAWMGYDDFSPLSRKRWTGGAKVVPMWAEYMRHVLKDSPVRDFPVPEGIVFAKIDAETGALALPGCPQVLLEAYRRGEEPTQFCPVDHTGPAPKEQPEEEPVPAPAEG